MSLSFDQLSALLTERAAAIRSVLPLQPAGGPHDKVFPATYLGAVYATEKRLLNGQEVDAVLLDSVQSQANRFEEALLEAYNQGRMKFPLIVADFSRRFQDFGYLRPGWITSLEAPHRIADALFRECTLNGTPFRESPEGKRFEAASIRNATVLFELCPTALVFGVWDSTGARGGLGNKFSRALVSEIIGYRAIIGVRTASRIDPTGIERCEVYEAENGTWTVDPERARMNRDKPVLFGKNPRTKGKPSAINLGNVTPDIVRDERTNEPLPGGVTLDRAEQITVLSLSALRRLRFPDEEGVVSSERDLAAQRVLTALALAAVCHQREQGFFLRSRCHLVPTEESNFEVVGQGDESQQFVITAEDADELFKYAVDEAIKVGLPWREEPLILQPREELCDLIQRSREQTAAETGAE